MSKVKIQGNASGTGVLTVTAPNTSTDRTITLPDFTGTLLTSTVRTATNEEDAILIEQSDGGDIGSLRINNGSFIIKGKHTSNPVQIQTHDGNEDIEVDPDGFIKFETGGSERMRVTDNGLTFNGDTASANALDDYEEGTWTPTLTCTNSGSYTLQGAADLCAYTKVGRVVHIQGSISINGESSPNGNLRITLPLTAFTGTDDTDYSMGNLAIGNHGGSYPSNINAFVQSGAYFYPWGVNDNGTTFYLSDSVVDTNFQIHFNFSYITSA